MAGSTAVHGFFTTMNEVRGGPRVRQPWVVAHVAPQHTRPAEAFMTQGNTDNNRDTESTPCRNRNHQLVNPEYADDVTRYVNHLPPSPDVSP